MVAMELEQPLPGELPQPRVEWQQSLAEVAGEPPSGVGERLLNDIRGVDAGRQSPIQVEGDHLPQSAAVPGQQPLARSLVAVLGRPKQFELIGVGLARLHRRVPLYY